MAWGLALNPIRSSPCARSRAHGEHVFAVCQVKATRQRDDGVVRPLTSVAGWRTWRQHRHEGACCARQRRISPCALDSAHGNSVFRSVAIVRRVLLGRHTVNTRFAVCPCFRSRRKLLLTANSVFPVVNITYFQRQTTPSPAPKNIFVGAGQPPPPSLPSYISTNR